MICSNKLKFILFGLLFIESKIDAVGMPENISSTSTNVFNTASVMTSTTTSSSTTSVNYMAQINAYITNNKNRDSFPISGVIKISNNSNLITIQTSSTINANTVKDVQAYLQKIVQPKRVNISVLKDKKIITIRIEFYNL